MAMDIPLSRKKLDKKASQLDGGQVTALNDCRCCRSTESS